MKRQMKWVIENIDFVITLFLVIIVAILDVFGDALGDTLDKLVRSLTLAVLGLIAVSLYLMKHRIEEITKANVQDLIYFSDKKPTSLEENLRDADEVWMLGVNMRKTTEGNFYHFLKKASGGGKIRVLIASPSEANVNEVTARFRDPGVTVKTIAGHFEEVLARYSEIKAAARSDDSCQVRLLDFVPPYSLYIFPRTKDDGVVYVEVYGHKSETGKSGSLPKFQVTERENFRWYRHFVDQFEVMWKQAKVYDEQVQNERTKNN
jgi:hypothetical protein